MRRFFIDSAIAASSEPFLDKTNTRHLKTVLRLVRGDIVTLFDGEGKEYKAEILGFSENQTRVRILYRSESGFESPARITIAQAVLKGKKMDGIVRMLTELGMAAFIPFQSERSVPCLDKKKQMTRIERWKKISGESLKQCRRSVLPEIRPICTFQDIIGMASDFDIRFICWEKGGDRFSPDPGKDFTHFLAVVGPEGGFSENEIKMAEANGFLPLSLGPRILRAETAPITACVLLQHRFGDL